MTTNQNMNYYCRLEIFSCNHLIDEKNKIEEKSLCLSQENAYIEYYDNIHTLKERILSLTKLWLIQHSHVDEPLLYKEEKSSTGNEPKDNKWNKYPGFAIINGWGDWNLIGVCSRGWFIGGNNFHQYMRHYAIGIYGIPEYGKILGRIPAKNFEFFIPDMSEKSEIELLTNELSDIELENFLDGKEITEEIKQKIYYPEMVRRGYIDIIGKNE